MKRFLILLCGVAVAVGIIITLAGGLITGFFFQDTKAPFKAPKAEVTVPRFRQVDLPFDHTHNNEESLPFAAGAWIDIDQSGTPELFLGGDADKQTVCLVMSRAAFGPTL